MFSLKLGLYVAAFLKFLKVEYSISDRELDWLDMHIESMIKNEDLCLETVKLLEDDLSKLQIQSYTEGCGLMRKEWNRKFKGLKFQMFQHFLPGAGVFGH